MNAGPGARRAHAARLRAWRRSTAGLILAAALGAGTTGAAAGLPRTCEEPDTPDAARVALALRVAAAVHGEFARLQAPVAIVARAGLDLSLLGQRYSHAGLSLRDHPQGAWTVRQLYFACEEGRPRIFDQGLAAFVLGNDPRVRAQLVAILPGPLGAHALAGTALDDRLARALLGASYSANAYAFSDLHQNCNQWVAELLALAWGGPSGEAPRPRARAQAWLREQGFEPTVVQVGWPPLRLLRPWLPWVREDDHPEAELQAGRYLVVMPESLERFTRRLQPQARRLEFCLDDSQRLVVREGWEPLGQGCEPGVADRVIELAPPASP